MYSSYQMVVDVHAEEPVSRLSADACYMLEGLCAVMATLFTYFQTWGGRSYGIFFSASSTVDALCRVVFQAHFYSFTRVTTPTLLHRASVTT
jgi:hypothetical protein